MTGSNDTRIALFYYSPFRGEGVARMFLMLARVLAERGHAVDLLCVTADGPLADELAPGVRLFELKHSGMLRRLIRMAAYFRTAKPDAVISAMDIANSCALARSLAGSKTRVVASYRVPLSYYFNMRGGIYRVVGPFLARWLLPRADIIATVSRGVAKDAAALTHAPDKIVTIYNPVEVERVQELAREPVDHPWYAASNVPVVLGVGRLEKQKDFATLIRAFRRVRDKTEARLVILGEGSERTGLEALIDELGLGEDVWLPGFDKNPYRYMARSSVFVLSSIAEGFGNVLLEALAVDTPVVSTDCEAGPREILGDGAYGRLVPVGDVTALARCITEAFADPVCDRGRRSRARMFSVDATVERYLQAAGIAPDRLSVH